MSRGTIARINMGAANHNLAVIQKNCPDAKIWAVVKANAYGHGATSFAPKLKHCHGFAVATLNEALALRQSGIHKPILLLEGCLNVKQTKVALENKCSLVLHNIEQIEDLEKLTQNLAFNQISDRTIWLKVDTGMHRLGLPIDQLQISYDRITKLSWVKQVGVMSHFSCADDSENTFTDLQIKRLKQALPSDCTLVSMANSAGIFNYSESICDWVRPGIALYGASAILNKSAESLGLLPVMELTAPIIAIRQVEKGESTGYGNIWTATKPTKIATVAIGYGDGYPRTCLQGTPVFVNQTRAELIGRVSMDLITIDVTDIDVKLYDTVQLWGKDISVDEVASHCGTIGYELLTRITSRVQYIYE
ncbi:alanine racemase [Marinicellulosiphila megalodicopiae]|uniref:alanine racemase n=1 Tax=Marinicellulosiphila megalodicopiae TaxID=2724896 RepID=UPI003BAF5B94